MSSRPITALSLVAIAFAPPLPALGSALPWPASLRSAAEAGDDPYAPLSTQGPLAWHLLTWRAAQIGVLLVLASVSICVILSTYDRLRGGGAKKQRLPGGYGATSGQPAPSITWGSLVSARGPGQRWPAPPPEKPLPGDGLPLPFASSVTRGTPRSPSLDSCSTGGSSPQCGSHGRDLTLTPPPQCAFSDSALESRLAGFAAASEALKDIGELHT
mmetsp:Transcript_102659/g.290660  ORF Transcript_102659/g.290660 Transcript_102659/m.290660 type:complete len:215 (-) Transcript_102659:211-855(-)